MKYLKYLTKITFESVLIAIGIFIAILFTVIGNFVSTDGVLSPTILSSYGGFIGGTVGILFTLAGYLIISKSFLLQKKQTFDNRFFYAFREFNEFRTKQIGLLYLPSHLAQTNEPRELHSGYKFFETFFNSEESLGINSEFQFGQKTTRIKIRKAFKTNRNQMAQYFSHLNMLIYSIDSFNSDEAHKTFYMKYICDQLSDHEQFLIHFYELHEDHKNFELLERISIKNILLIESLVEL